jgi:hypothetical protein
MMASISHLCRDVLIRSDLRTSSTRSSTLGSKYTITDFRTSPDRAALLGAVAAGSAAIDNRFDVLFKFEAVAAHGKLDIPIQGG